MTKHNRWVLSCLWFVARGHRKRKAGGGNPVAAHSRGRLGAGGRPRGACTIGIVHAGRGCAQSFHRSNGVSLRGLYRELHNLSQAELGEKLGSLSRQNISNMENGRRGISKALAKRTRITLGLALKWPVGCPLPLTPQRRLHQASCRIVVDQPVRIEYIICTGGCDEA